MEHLKNSSFWRAAALRAVRTVAQTMVAMIPAMVTITEVDWPAVIGTAALSGVCSLLTSIGTDLPEV